MNLKLCSSLAMMISMLIFLSSMVFVFILESQISISLLVLGHTAAMLSALVFKIGYIMRLESIRRSNVAHVLDCAKN